jgi:hypothetical protein
MTKKQQDLIDLICHQVRFSLLQFPHEPKPDPGFIRKLNLSEIQFLSSLASKPGNGVLSIPTVH